MVKTETNPKAIERELMKITGLKPRAKEAPEAWVTRLCAAAISEDQDPKILDAMTEAAYTFCNKVADAVEAGKAVPLFTGGTAAAPAKPGKKPHKLKSEDVEGEDEEEEENQDEEDAEEENPDDDGDGEPDEDSDDEEESEDEEEESEDDEESDDDDDEDSDEEEESEDDEESDDDEDEEDEDEEESEDDSDDSDDDDDEDEDSDDSDDEDSDDEESDDDEDDEEDTTMAKKGKKVTRMMSTITGEVMSGTEAYRRLALSRMDLLRPYDKDYDRVGLIRLGERSKCKIGSHNMSAVLFHTRQTLIALNALHKVKVGSKKTVDKMKPVPASESKPSKKEKTAPKSPAKASKPAKSSKKTKKTKKS